MRLPIVTEGANPHPSRARELLRAQPSLRALFGPTRWTAVLTVALVAVQLGLAAVATRVPWWGAVLLAYGVGAFVSHALYAVLHECSHWLAARSKRGNRVVALLANVPLVVPMVDAYAHFHRMHHRHQGDPDRDPDLPLPAELRWSRTRAGKLAWHLAFPWWQLRRTARLPPPRRTPWMAANVVAQALAVAALVGCMGPKALVYLALSLYFTLAAHPLSGRLVQEHHLVGSTQATTSYAGWVNAIALHVGLHNEHHDFPAVPWTRLPELRRRCASLYVDTLVSHRSWARLWLRFLVDPCHGPGGRVVRRPMAG